SGAAVLALWLNRDGDPEDPEDPESEPDYSVRWAVLHEGRDPVLGVLPDAADSVLAKAVVHTADGFAMLLIKQRPNAVALLRYPISRDGDIGAGSTETLPYEPAVVPVTRHGEGTVWMWG